MNRISLRRSMAGMLILSALLLAACTGDVPETTAPAGTTAPIQTTAPVETTLPTEPVISLAPGEYLVNEVAADEAGVTNEECGVTLRPDGTFLVYMGWGVWHEGRYKIRDNTLLCTSDALVWDGGAGPGSRETEVVFAFAIRSENLLELTRIDIHDDNPDNLIYPDGLSVGMTYSIRGNS